MILRDPVHGVVAFEGPNGRVVPRLIDAAEMQRLRRVRALGVASMAFPGAEHSRFAHAVGAAHVMARFLARVEPLAEALGAPLDDVDHDDALAAALLHDLGHGPLSHLFEEVFPGMHAHELWTSAVILDPDTGVHRALAAREPEMPSRVERLVHGVHRMPLLARAVSGTLDVDRCDYLLRDSHMTGTRYGLFDLDWLLRSLALEPDEAGPRLAVEGSKGLPAVEGFFLARLFMYQQVYFHKATRAAEGVLRSTFRRLADLVADGRVPAGTPAPIAALARGEPISTRAYLSLDDNVLWCALEAWCDDRDAVLSGLAARCARRDLFKTASLDDLDPELDETVRVELEALVSARGYDPRYFAALDVAEVTPFEASRIPEEGLRVVHARRPAQPLEHASFIVSRIADTAFVRRRLVFPAEVRGAVSEMLEARRPGR
jgi:HD superfamily phosphohydrolase